VTRWRKRPVEVEAIRWTGGNRAEVSEFAGGAYFDIVPPEDRAEDPDQTAEVYDKLHGTWVHVYDGQWIIRGVKGELYPCADDVFAATYEAAETDAKPSPAESPASVPAEPAAACTDATEGVWTESPGVALIAVERSRQVTAEGYTPEHDADHDRGQLALAAAAYALAASGRAPQGSVWWPFDDWDFKPGDDPVRMLAKAGALIAAELDRLIAKGRDRG